MSSKESNTKTPAGGIHVAEKKFRERISLIDKKKKKGNRMAEHLRLVGMNAAGGKEEKEPYPHKSPHVGQG